MHARAAQPKRRGPRLIYVNERLKSSPVPTMVARATPDAGAGSRTGGCRLHRLTGPLLCALLLAVPAWAQTTTPGTPTGGTMATDGAASNTKELPPSAATRGYMEAARLMHLDMAVPFTNDADKDFALVMQAHGKGTVALARVEVEHGKDPEMRRLAEEVIAANERETALLQAWQ